MAIYTESNSHKKEIPALLTYARDTRVRAQRGMDFLGFDKHFRIDREFNRCPWDEIRPDLNEIYRSRPSNTTQGTGAANFRPSTSFPSNSQQQSQRSRYTMSSDKKSFTTADGHSLPVGQCIQFHTKGVRCEAGNTCKWRHTCEKCGARHPVYTSCKTYRNGPKGDNNRDGRHPKQGR